MPRAETFRVSFRPLRVLSGLATVALIVLASRSIVYALSPSPLAVALSHRAGGPTLPVLAIVSLGLALGLSAAVVWLATLGVRERRLLERRPAVSVPRVRLGLLAGRTLGLWLLAMPVFAYLESFIHWRQGLGWHGFQCLVGPVHRNAIPVLGALSLVAAALAGAIEHIVAWMRRTIARLAAEPIRFERTAPPAPAYEPVLIPAYAAPLGARGPPLHA
jgi:hypothetical protein